MNVQPKKVTNGLWTIWGGGGGGQIDFESPLAKVQYPLIFLPDRVCSSDKSPLCMKTSGNTRPMLEPLTVGTEISSRPLCEVCPYVRVRRIGIQVFAG